MDRRSHHNDYTEAGIYHITLHAEEGLGQPFGRVTGDSSKPDGAPDAPRVELTAIGNMVEQELTHSIPAFYPMVEVQTHVVMPEHVHVILEVHSTLVSRQGKKAHLGQVIAGFKKGCNRRFWALQQGAAAAQQGAATAQRGKPADTETGRGESTAQRGKPAGTETGRGESTAQRGNPAGTEAGRGENTAQRGKPADTETARGEGAACPAVYPRGYKVPSAAHTERTPLFKHGYVDVMPLERGQLQVQRAYIQNNPRSRLMRMQNRAWLQTQRGGIDTALTVKALMGYLQRECHPSQMDDTVRRTLEERLLTTPHGMIDIDSYGNRALLQRRLLPVVCHRKDRHLFVQQKERCLTAAREGAVLVSARIAKGEQEIMDAASAQGCATIRVEDNGMTERFHPSTENIERCAAGRLLLVTPWRYRYRPADEEMTVAACKTMNCVVQALCRLKDSWWQEGHQERSEGKTESAY